MPGEETTTDKKSADTYAIDKSLQKVAKGTSIVFIGSIFFMLSSFIARLLFVRVWSQSEFGVYSLAIAILTILTVICMLGMTQGIVRSIAYNRGKQDYKKVSKFFYASMYIGIAISLSIAFILFLFSEFIAEGIFHETLLVIPLRIISLIIPFSVLTTVLVSVFRGFDQVRQMLYFQYILLSLLFLIFLVTVIMFNLSFIYVFFAHAASMIITCILLVIYTVKKLPPIAFSAERSIDKEAAKELLIFSSPLLVAALSTSIINWTDTLILGGLRTSAEVGLYNVARPLASFIIFLLNALLFIYMPIISGLYAKGLIEEIKRNYVILTKWLASASLPIFLLLFLYSELIIGWLFGQAYIPAANVLRIISIGAIFHNFIGPAGATLVAMGRTRFIMFASLSAAALSIGLNFLLIPYLGIVGAAVAVAASIITFNLLKVFKLYLISGVHPISKNLLKPTLVFLILVLPIYFILQNFLIIEWWMLFFLLILFYAMYILSVLLTKSVDQEDLKMFLIVKRKIGLNRVKSE